MKSNCLVKKSFINLAKIDIEMLEIISTQGRIQDFF